MSKTSRFEIRRAKTHDPRFYFVAIAPNGRTLVKSELYSSKPMCLRGLNALREVARGSGSVLDTTVNPPRAVAR